MIFHQNHGKKYFEFKLKYIESRKRKFDIKSQIQELDTPYGS